jgi:hypothetical protein
MELSRLLDEARSAPSAARIELRDPIAAYGTKAIEALKPWLVDEQMAAFAVRVLGRIGVAEPGSPLAAAAATALRGARKRVTPVILADIEWELGQIRAASVAQAKEGVARPAAKVVAAPRARPVRAAGVARHRSG